MNPGLPAFAPSCSKSSTFSATFVLGTKPFSTSPAHAKLSSECELVLVLPTLPRLPNFPLAFLIRLSENGDVAPNDRPLQDPSGCDAPRDGDVLRVREGVEEGGAEACVRKR